MAYIVSHVLPGGRIITDLAVGAQQHTPVWCPLYHLMLVFCLVVLPLAGSSRWMGSVGIVLGGGRLAPRCRLLCRAAFAC